MSITNISKPNSSIANATKINIGVTWDADLLTWATESRTWDATASIINNATKILSAVTNLARPT